MSRVLAVEHGGQLRGRGLLLVWHRVGVDVQRHLDLGVAEPSLNDVRRHSFGQQQGRRGVAETMELDPADAR